MQIEPNGPGTAGYDHEADELRRLSAALRDLSAQIDFDDYREHRGPVKRESPAYRAAQTLVERFGLTQDQLRETLEGTDLAGDLTAIARRLTQLRTADPSDVPPEYRTWHTGP